MIILSAIDSSNINSVLIILSPIDSSIKNSILIILSPIDHFFCRWVGLGTAGDVQQWKRRSRHWPGATVVQQVNLFFD